MSSLSDFTTSWLQVEEGLGGARPVLHGTAEEMRAQFSGLCSLLASQLPPPSLEVSTTDGSVNGIGYRVYKPQGHGASGLPLGVFYHSGGFVVGDLDSEDAFCRAITLSTKVIVVSVGYSLAPEHKLPTQLDEALAMYEWTFNNAALLGGDTSKMFAIGTSAGGALALAVTRMVSSGRSSLSKHAVRGLVALSPLTLHPDSVPAKYKDRYTAFQENAENVPIIDQLSLRQMFDNAQVKASDQRLFPLLDSACVQQFPPTYIVTCEKDPLRDDGRILHEALSAAGIQVKADHYEKLPHCFWFFHSLPESDIFMANLQRALEWLKDEQLN